MPMPINLDTINSLYGLNLTSFEVEEFFNKVAEPVEHVRTSEDVVVSKVGRELYEKFFRNYTRKQWGLHPRELDATVCGRIPVRLNHDSRYVDHRYQMMPAHGFTALFDRMLRHRKIRVLLDCPFQDVRHLIRPRHCISLKLVNSTKALPWVSRTKCSIHWMSASR